MDFLLLVLVLVLVFLPLLLSISTAVDEMSLSLTSYTEIIEMEKLVEVATMCVCMQALSLSVEDG